MKRMKVSAIGFLGLLAMGLALAGQTPTPQNPSPDRAKILDVARKIMDKSVYCAFITLGEDGQPQARTVQPFAPDAGMVVWIGTNPGTRKIAQIKKDPRVSLYYYADMAYVTLLGKAELVNDPAEKQKHWNDAWTGLYKDKFRGDDYTLIRVIPIRLEILSYGDGIMNDPKTLKPTTVDFKEPSRPGRRP
jgi:general stress protein 26